MLSRQFSRRLLKKWKPGKEMECWERWLWWTLSADASHCSEQSPSLPRVGWFVSKMPPVAGTFWRTGPGAWSCLAPSKLEHLRDLQPVVGTLARTVCRLAWDERRPDLSNTLQLPQSQHRLNLAPPLPCSLPCFLGEGVHPSPSLRINSCGLDFTYVCGFQAFFQPYVVHLPNEQVSIFVLMWEAQRLSDLTGIHTERDDPPGTMLLMSMFLPPE